MNNYLVTDFFLLDTSPLTNVEMIYMNHSLSPYCLKNLADTMAQIVTCRKFRSLQQLYRTKCWNEYQLVHAQWT